MPSALAIAPTDDQLVQLRKLGYAITIWTMEPSRYPDYSPLMVDIRKPWSYSASYDLVICTLWPQETGGQMELLKRFRKVLNPSGRVEITRKYFERHLTYNVLPTDEPINNWLLTSTLKALPPIPEKQKLIIENLQDKYPQKVRFLAAILDSLNKICNLNLEYNTNEANQIIMLKTSGSIHITLELDCQKQQLSATMEPADSKIFPVLSRLCTSTFTNDIESSSQECNKEFWTTTVIAKS